MLWSELHVFDISNALRSPHYREKQITRDVMFQIFTLTKRSVRYLNGIFVLW